MQADKDLARRLGQLNEQARKEREDLSAELHGIREAAAESPGGIGLKAIKTASVIGLADPKVLGFIGRSVIAPLAVGAGKRVYGKLGAKRAVGFGLICAVGAAIAKGIAYDRARKQEKKS